MEKAAPSARSQDAGNGGQRGIQIIDVRQPVIAGNAVEYLAFKRPRRGGVHAQARDAERLLVLGPCLVQQRVGDVNPYDARAAAGALEQLGLARRRDRALASRERHRLGRATLQSRDRWFGYMNQYAELSANTRPGARGLQLPPQLAVGNPPEDTPATGDRGFTGRGQGVNATPLSNPGMNGSDLTPPKWNPLGVWPGCCRLVGGQAAEEPCPAPTNRPARATRC